MGGHAAGTRSPSRAVRLAALAAATALLAACAPGPEPSASAPPPATPPASVLPSLPAETPFARQAWPADGSACDREGYSGLLGRVEAVAERTVRFTLCGPDSAFLARIAHPALGIVDAAVADLAAEDPTALRLAEGAGTYRVDAWTEDANVRLERVAGTDPAGDVPDGAPPILILRWATRSAERVAALEAAEVDGIDRPSDAEAAALETLPELSVVPRPGLATAYLGFGDGRPYGSVAVRRAFAQALDHEALARDAFPAGSLPATHLAPCLVPGGCAGIAWYEFNGPAAAAELARVGFDTDGRVPLRVPDAAVPGLPDPERAGEAVRDGLEESLGLRVQLQVEPVAELRAAIEAGEVTGLYLWGIRTPLADPSGFLGPLFGPGERGTPAARGKEVTKALREAAGTVDPAARRTAFAAANDALRDAAALVPLVHPGTTMAWRADVAGAAVSPLGADPVGDLVPGDRRQLVIMGTVPLDTPWCAGTGEPDALRLCALVTPGLYAFGDGGLEPRPALANRCTPSDDAATWTCRLAPDVRFGDGRRLDAGDVLASFRAMGDPAGGLRTDGRPAPWDALFGPLPTDP